MMNEGYSLSDIAAATGNGVGGRDGGWGENGSWWIILFLIFAWGGNGFGGFGGQNGALTRGDLCQDMNFADLQGSVRSINDTLNSNFRTMDNAVCTLGYNQAQLINGVERQIAGEFRGLDNAICTLGYQTQQGFNGLTSQIADCCCKTQTGIQGVNYNMATQAGETRNVIQSGFRDVMENQNANARAILDRLTSQEIAAKDAQIAAQNQKLFLAELTSSQATQSQMLIDRLRPCPSPAYITCNPWANQSAYGSCGCCG